MTCNDLQWLIPGYVAAELAPAQEEFVSIHLRECPSCRETAARLRLTRRQLEALRFDGYNPHLTDRINGALARRSALLALGRWTGFGVRMGLPVLAAAMAVLALFLVFRTPAFNSPASAEHPAYAIPGARVADSFLQVDGELHQWVPNGNHLRRIGPVEGALLGASPDGRTAWLLRQLTPDSFAVDGVDVATAQVYPGPEIRPGRALSGAVSSDGGRLYILAMAGEDLYLKAIDASARQREEAARLPALGEGAQVLRRPGSDTIYVIGDGRLVRVATSELGVQATYDIPGITPAAVFAPDGSALAAARRSGGIILVDPESGRAMRQITGALYDSLIWAEQNRLFATGKHGGDLLTYPGLRQMDP